MSYHHYAIVIDTTQYAGNFHREMAAYVIGRSVDAYCGHEFARLASGSIKNKAWINEHIVEKEVRYHDAPRSAYSDMFERRFAEFPTNYLYAMYSHYNSIIIFFDEKPPVNVVEEIVERSLGFAKNLKDIYEKTGNGHALTNQSNDFSSQYSLLKNNIKTLDIADIRFFEVSTARKLYDEKNPYRQVAHEYQFIRTEESFMLEHKLKKAKTEKEINHYQKKLNKLTKQEKTLVLAYLNNEVEAYKLQVNETMFLLYKIDYFMDEGLSLNQLNDYYQKFGYSLQSLKGQSELTKNMYAIPYDNVQYVVKQLPQNHRIEKNVNDYNTVVQKHHKKIKEIYHYLKSKNAKDVWVYPHINGTITATFGNSSGVIAQIELGEEESPYRTVKDIKTFKLFTKKKNLEKYFTDHTIKNINVKERSY